MLPLTTFYRSGAPRNDVYKWDAFVTSWRFYNRAWQPQRHDRPPETSGTLWIHRGALTNQRCSLATGCGINTEQKQNLVSLLSNISSLSDTKNLLSFWRIVTILPRAVLAWWRHQMETFSVLLAICAGNSLVNSPHKGQWRGALMFSLICTWTNGWVNIRKAVDLGSNRAHYDITVMGN